MRDWQRRVLGVITIAGGGVGISSTMPYMMVSTYALDWLFCIGFVLLFSWGIWCGIQLLEKHPNAVRANFKFWLVQVPVFNTPVLGYFFASGAYLSVWVGLDSISYNYNAMLGSGFQYSFLNDKLPTLAGVNVLALIMSLWFYRQADGSNTPS
ncbi:hypothetical protein LG331_06475 [Vreelandella aquamarina]|uniref:hypothetical protein n=1 Tax=Vreelandella aquamarina TaxID=77097 RepID=UPI00384BB203